MVAVSRRKALHGLGGLACLSTVAVPFRPTRGATPNLRIAYQPSLNYLPLMIVEHEKIIEAHLNRAGRKIEISWLQFTAGGPMNDAILADQIDIASGGITVFAVLWDKTRGRQNVLGLTSLAASPFFLNVNKPSIRALGDFSENDRIAVPMAKISPNAIVLQMAAEKIFGPGKHDRLDPLIVSLGNPEAQAALLSGKTEITGHMSAPPFCFEQLRRPAIHRVMSSSEILGDDATTIVTWATSSFAEKNPELAEAFISALREANELITNDPGRAAEIYKAAMNAASSVEEIKALLKEPSISFSVAPKNSTRMVSFMHRVGMITKPPADWKELFLRQAHALGGS